MLEEILFLSDKEKLVRCLGLKLNCVPTDVRVYVNGQDISKNIVVEEIKVVIEKKG